MPSVKEEDVFVYSSSSTIRGGTLPEDPDEDIEKTDELRQRDQAAATSVAVGGAPWFFRKPRQRTEKAGSAADVTADDERMPSPLSGESIVGGQDSSEVSAFSLETKHHKAEERPTMLSPVSAAYGIVAREVEAREKKAKEAFSMDTKHPKAEERPTVVLPASAAPGIVAREVEAREKKAREAETAMTSVTGRQAEKRDEEREVQTTRAAVAAGVAAAGVAAAGAAVAAMADEKEDRTKQQESAEVRGS